MTADDTTQRGAAAPLPGAAGFHDPTRITRILTWLLWASLVLDAAAVVSGLLEYQLLQQFQSGQSAGMDMDAAATANDLRQRVIGITQVALFIATVIAFSRWIYILSGNKSRLGATGLHFTPGWAVGWFFIPIANLWKPYQATKELWLVSADPQRWQAQERSELLPWWWFVWLLSNALGQLSFRLTLNATEIPDLILANVATDLADFSSVFLDGIALVLVGRIARMQIENSRRNLRSLTHT